jgi:hypothetical protein
MQRSGKDTVSDRLRWCSFRHKSEVRHMLQQRYAVIDLQSSEEALPIIKTRRNASKIQIRYGGQAHYGGFDNYKNNRRFFFKYK